MRSAANFVICTEVAPSTPACPWHLFQPLPLTSPWALLHFIWISCSRKKTMWQVAWPLPKMHTTLIQQGGLWMQFPVPPLLHVTICRPVFSLQGLHLWVHLGQSCWSPLNCSQPHVFYLLDVLYYSDETNAINIFFKIEVLRSSIYLPSDLISTYF